MYSYSRVVTREFCIASGEDKKARGSAGGVLSNVGRNLPKSNSVGKLHPFKQVAPFGIEPNIGNEFPGIVRLLHDRRKCIGVAGHDFTRDRYRHATIFTVRAFDLS